MKHIKNIFASLAVLALLIPALPVQAATSYAGQVIKGFGPQVYFVTKDDKRLVFPNEATYKSWYPDFRNVIAIPDWDIDDIPLVGTVAMKPGVKLIKAQGDNRVYAVARYGVARWVSTPSTASVIYGAHWYNNIIEVAPSTLASYVKGGDVSGPDQYWWMRERDSVKTIQDNFDPTFDGMRQLVGTAPITTSAQLTLKAIVVNGTDGRFNATDSDAKLFIGSLPVKPGVAYAVAPGDYTLYQVDIPAFVTSSWSGDCGSGGTVGLNAGDKKVCTITYTYSAEAAKEPVLIANVNVVNRQDGKLIPDDFSLFVGSMHVKSGEKHSYGPGTYKLWVSNNFGYIPMGWSGDCNGDGTIDLQRGHTYTCTYTYQDVMLNQFHPTMGNLVLNAVVNNSHGGTLKPSNIKLFIEGKQVSSGQLNEVDPRGYTAYRTDPVGYTTTGWQGDCNAGGQVQVKIQSIQTCTVVYTQN